MKSRYHYEWFQCSINLIFQLKILACVLKGNLQATDVTKLSKKSKNYLKSILFQVLRRSSDGVPETAVLKVEAHCRHWSFEPELLPK